MAVAMESVEIPLATGVGLFIVICYQFLGVSILCDERLCPSLERLCDSLKIPTALAAASLLSFGSSAPELIIATFGAVGNKTELSVPAVLCSALIAFAAIPPMVVLASGTMKLHIKEVVRDALSYAVVLILFVIFSLQKKIGGTEAAILVATYFVYLVIVHFTELKHDDDEDAVDPEKAKAHDKLEASSQTSTDTSKTPEAVGTPATAATAATSAMASPAAEDRGTLNERLLDDKDAAAEEEDEEASHPVIAFLGKPFMVAFELTIPGDSRPAYQGFVASMLWLCVLSYGALECTATFADVIGLSKATAGVTLLAWGGQLPDTIAAVALARRGMPDEAISQAIASQVINVSIGLGLPFLVFTAASGEPTITKNSQSVVMIALTVLGSIVGYLFIMCLGLSSWRDLLPSNFSTGVATITPARAVMLAAFFTVFYLGAIYAAEVHAHA